MNSILYFLIFILATGKVQAAYEILTEVQRGNDTPRLGKVILEEGGTAKIQSDDIILKIQPLAYGLDAVHVKSQVFMVEADGSEKLLGSPQVITKLGQSAEITTQGNTEDGNKDEEQQKLLRVKFTPKKI